MVTPMRYYNSDMESAISECVHSERDRLVLRLRLIDGWTHEQIAAHPNVDRTPKQIYNIISKYKDDLFTYIQQEQKQKIS
jgi:hypothetical protein